MNLDPIVEEKGEAESVSPYSPSMVALVTQQNDHTTLANILREMEISRRETFEQLRADRRQSEMMLKEHIQRLENREKERRGRRSSSESSIGSERRGRRHDFDGERRRNNPPQRQHLQFEFPSSKESMIPTSTLSGRKKRIKFSIFIYLVT